MNFLQSRNIGLTLIFIVVFLALNFTDAAGVTVSSSTSNSGRNLIEVQDSYSESRKRSDDTVRVDPLDHLKKYRGGYDIRNKHYWSSTAFTGIYGYAIGVLWLLCGLLYGLYLLVTTFCLRSNRKLKKRAHCDKQCYLWPILLATIFTILAITASGVVLGGNAKFYSRAKTIIDIIIDTADDASETMYNTTAAMRDISDNFEQSNVAADASSFLTSTSERLDSEAADIERQARKHRKAIEKGLRIVYIITTATISVNLVAAIVLSVFGILKLRRPLQLLIILCWLLTVLSWLFFGVYFFVGKFAGDTCTAFQDFRQDPYNNSLSSILPCDDLLSAEPVLHDVSTAVYDIVDQMNQNISVQYPYIARICNPFSAPPQYQYQPEDCPPNSIHIRDIPQLLKIITCTDPSCIGGIYITDSELRMVMAYTTSLDKLLNVYPGMESLVQCQTVKDAFTEIIDHHCKPVKRDAKIVWAALVALSLVMVALILIWTMEAQHDRTHHFADGSVKPNSPKGEAIESGTAPEVNNNDSNIKTV